MQGTPHSQQANYVEVNTPVSSGMLLTVNKVNNPILGGMLTVNEEGSRLLLVGVNNDIGNSFSNDSNKANPILK